MGKPKEPTTFSELLVALEDMREHGVRASWQIQTFESIEILAHELEKVING